MGKKTLTKVQIISAVLLCCWLILVVGLTLLSRGSNFTGSLNIDFFSSYMSAWNNWSVSELQLIIFNMLMFAPLGFLLPLLWKRAEKLWVILTVSLDSVVMSHAYVFSSIILSDFRQKFAGVLVVRQEFLTKKPTKFAGKACADTCDDTA